MRKATHKKPSNVLPGGWKNNSHLLVGQGEMGFGYPYWTGWIPIDVRSQGKNTDEATINCDPVLCGLWLNRQINGKLCFDREDDTVPTKILISAGIGSKASEMGMP